MFVESSPQNEFQSAVAAPNDDGSAGKLNSLELEPEAWIEVDVIEYAKTVPVVKISRASDDAMTKDNFMYPLMMLVTDRWLLF